MQTTVFKKSDKSKNVHDKKNSPDVQIWNGNHNFIKVLLIAFPGTKKLDSVLNSKLISSLQLRPEIQILKGLSVKKPWNRVEVVKLYPETEG